MAQPSSLDNRIKEFTRRVIEETKTLKTDEERAQHMSKVTKDVQNFCSGLSAKDKRKLRQKGGNKLLQNILSEAQSTSKHPMLQETPKE